jgi:hypothetical protein
MWKTGTTSVSSDVTVRLVQAIGERKELCVPMTLISKTHLKTIKTTAIIDSGVAGIFISKDFIKLHRNRTHHLSKPFKVTTTNGSLSKSGPITHYCILTIKIDECAMIGKFNVMRLGKHDQILLGIPWLHAMDPIIRWKAGMLSLPRTLKSDLIEEDIDNERRKNRLPSLFLKKQKYEHSRLPKEPVKPERIDSMILMQVESVSPERVDSMTPFSVKLEEIPDEDAFIPADTTPVFDTKEDIWDNYEPMVTDIATYQLHDEDVLIEYSADGMEMRLIENVSFDIPLTKDGTSKNEMKFSNKAQQFAVTGVHSEIEQKKKPFEELVPGYLHDFCDIFAKDGLNCLPPECPGIDHCIEMKPGFILKTSKIYPLSKKERSAVKTFIDENMKKGFISESKSPQASGFFFIGKKSRELCPCQDYQYINDWMIKNSYLLPLPLTLIACLHNAKYFTKMDVRSGYNNIRIHPDDRWKAAFTTEFRLFEPNVMFFGLCNSPATFQAYMNCTFQQEINEGWLVIYMDNILIFLKTLDEHQKRTRRILEIIHREQLFLKPEKCTFNAQEVEYLSMIIKPGCITMDPAKLDGIKDWPIPTTVKETWSFLGFCNFYQNFISHYSDLTRPLIDLTKKDVQFLWTDACNNSFLALKDCFLCQPVLQNPDPTRQFAVATDASLIATGAVLLQTDDNGQYHPCGYLSQSLNPAERNYQILTGSCSQSSGHSLNGVIS